MPVGYLATTGLIATCTFFALAPRRPRRPGPWNVSFFIGFLVNELPFIAAGAHLAASAALTPNDPAFHPGFESGDTSVVAVVCLYGYYGSLDATGQLPSSPLAYVQRKAPPFFVAHGDLDTLVLVEDTRRFVDGLRSTSGNPVVYAELPKAQHAFDLFHSIRFETVVDAIEAFAAWVRSRADR
jgi:acetyl esterase/lipase